MKRELLQVIEESPTFMEIVKVLDLQPDGALKFAVFIEKITAEALVAMAGEFIDAIDKAVITLARQHQDAETLKTIRGIQSAVHAIYTLAEKKK